METKTDIMWGIDRYVESLSRGVLVAPAIILWRRPGAGYAAKNMTGVLKHGTPVRILDKQQNQKRMWYLCSAAQGGRVQIGWCLGTLLKDIGAEEMRQNDE